MAAKPILNIQDHPITWVSATPPALGSVQEAILLGLVDKGWTGTAISPGLIEGSILVRGKHFASVLISFGLNRYSIQYKDSRNLDYNAEKKKIHRNYNKWIINLQNSIDRRLIEVQSGKT
jgi:hypothetical protein